MIKVLSVTSECVPLVKTGGLADVAGALPGAVAPFGMKMKTLIPGYRAVMSALKNPKVVMEVDDVCGETGRVLAAKVKGLDLCVLDAPHLFDRDGGIYQDAQGQDWPDNAERFAALSETAAMIAGAEMPDWVPDIVHCHDWQAGFAPYYMARNGVQKPSVMTVHNIAFQGLAPARSRSSLGIEAADYRPDRLEYYGKLSALKAGLVYASALTTVSPTYAGELLRPEFGMGLEGVLSARRADLTGILNGIDLDVWSPEQDPNIKPYKTARGKASNKAALRAEFGLPDADGPLCIVVSRLTEQKGLDLLLQALPTLLERGGQLALLGSGDRQLEEAFRAYGHENVSCHFGYDEALSHRMMAGGDAILVPSRFEPCGLTQLYGLRYGTLPVVALTGGLADTVIHASPVALDAGVATGIQFYPVSSQALEGALRQLCGLYAQPKVWAKMQRNAMAQDVGWSASASGYADLYKSLLS